MLRSYLPALIVSLLMATVSLAADSRPNLLVIVVDDQSPQDLRIYNPQSILDTPTLDKIAAEGMVFDGAYHMGSWSGAVCTPSRHMIMSGRSVWHIPTKSKQGKNKKAATVASEFVPDHLELQTLPAVFNRAGYATMRTCKTGNSYEAANQQFTVRRDAMRRGGDEATGSAWHAQQVLDYLDERTEAADQSPFLIYFGFSHPHDTRNGTPELLAKYGAVNHTDKSTPPSLDPKQPKLPINYLPAHPFPHGHPGLRDEEQVSGVWKRRDPATIRNELGREFACSENIDRQIDRVLKRLEQLGELENTYIIYTADHGMAIGRHGLQGKQNLYEHTWRVPLLVKGPGIASGTRVQGNVYLMDLLATVCDLTGVEAPPTNEGVSFKPVLMGKQATTRDVLYGVYCGGTKPGMRSVRRGPWKLIQTDVLDGDVHELQLFNLDDNPHEFLIEHHDPAVIALTGVTPRANQVNLAADAKYSDKLREMQTLLLTEMRRLHDPYRLWDQPASDLASK